MLDFSNYQEDSKLFDPTNKKVIGKLKEVFQGKVTSQFVGLNSKMHSMKSIVGKESNTTKGVNFATDFNEFKNTLFNKRIFRNEHKMKTFQSKTFPWYLLSAVG